MNSLVAVKITQANADDKGLRRLYETAFPVEEQIPYRDLFRLLATMPLDFKAYYEGEALVGLTVVLAHKDFNWFWYFAVSEELRGRGYGQQILTSLKEQYSGQSLIIDIESPNQVCDNVEQRHRRHGFYLRNGFHDTDTGKSFEGIDYTIMVLGDKPFTQKDYDDIINELRAYWRNMPSEEQ